MNLQKGFTLIEIMVVVVIIAILTSVAIPAYQDYIIRGKIADATSSLASKRVRIEQWFQDNQSYANAGATANDPCANDTASSKYFTFSCANLTTTTYTLQAVGGNATTGDQSMAGFTYTINESNTKQTTLAPAGWAAAAMPVSCWITKKGGTC